MDDVERKTSGAEQARTADMSNLLDIHSVRTLEGGWYGGNNVNGGILCYSTEPLLYIPVGMLERAYLKRSQIRQRNSQLEPSRLKLKKGVSVTRDWIKWPQLHLPFSTTCTTSVPAQIHIQYVYFSLSSSLFFQAQCNHFFFLFKHKLHKHKSFSHITFTESGRTEELRDDLSSQSSNNDAKSDLSRKGSVKRTVKKVKKYLSRRFSGHHPHHNVSTTRSKVLTRLMSYSLIAGSKL